MKSFTHQVFLIKLIIFLSHYHTFLEDWVLFMDTSLKSLKAVLMHKENSSSPISVAYAKNVKETYESVKEILNLLHYDDEQWFVCCDFKVK